jgi:hypothetical protein
MWGKYRGKQRRENAEGRTQNAEVKKSQASAKSFTSTF